MKKPDPFFGFVLVYFLLTGFQLFVNQIYFSGLMPSSMLFSMSVASSSMTNIDVSSLAVEVPESYHYFSLLITQLCNFTFLSFLLWYYWKLFGTSEEKRYRLVKAFKLTFFISIISESFLFLFFLYGIPAQNNKAFSALGMAVYSFANAGLPSMAQLINPEIIKQHFILQIGIVIGTTLGGMGIYVLYELLSPNKLRERLADSTIDWSFITKVSVFGTAIIFFLGSIAFYFMESRGFLKEQNILTAIIASVYEISAARGFGSSLSEHIASPSTIILKWIVSMIGSGPFSTGGGFTLLGLVWIITISRKKQHKSLNTQISNALIKNLLIYTFITFSLTFFLRMIFHSEFTFLALLAEQWKLYSMQLLRIDSSSGTTENLVVGLSIIAGRLGFIMACFLTLKQQKS